MPYYLRWVAQYQKFCRQTPDQGIPPESVTSFVSQLAKSHEDWQVLQARDAVRLYLYFSDKSLTANSTVLSSDHELVELNERMTNAMRLRHRSYRTEQSYKAWVRRFGAFLDHKSPQTIEQSDLQRFLSSLAVERRVSTSTQNQAFNALPFSFPSCSRKEGLRNGNALSEKSCRTVAKSSNYCCAAHGRPGRKFKLYMVI